MTDLMLRAAVANRNAPRTQFAPEALRAARTAAGFGVTEVASIVGVSYRAVERWERGDSKPNAVALPRVERVVAALLAAA